MHMTPKLRAAALTLAALTAAASAVPTSSPAATPYAGDAVVIKAGTIHLVEVGETIRDGAVLVEDGKIVAIGPADTIDVPGGASVVDHGPDAVIVPGLVAVDSNYTQQAAGPRTADPTLLAIDQFDPYTPIVSALRSGITTVYLPPARGRLIAGQGAVVKTGGGSAVSADGRVLKEHSGIHGSISSEARRTPGYWEPPVPATVDVGLGVPKPQLPTTTMGAVLAVDELMALAGGDDALVAEYGAQAGPALAAAMKEGETWRMGAETAAEVQALLELKQRHGMNLVIDGASRSASMASELAEAGVPVIAGPDYNGGNNFGKGATAAWPRYDTISRLAGEGVQVAIRAPNSLGAPDLRFGAALAMRGGLPRGAALSGITLNAAKVLGVDDRVGSLAPGKDGDMVVMSGDPMSLSSSVLATYVNGELAWSAELAGSKREGAKPSTSVVISVDELYVGDGVVHTPGEILVRDGKIAEVSARVGRPAGARVVRGAAAMPGMIDAYGYLGIGGGRRAFSTRFDLTRMLEPGDYTDREVAKRGVTSVNLTSPDRGGVTPSIAYKPAAADFDGLVVDPVASVMLQWDSSIITQSGASVRGTLNKAMAYAAKWKKYEADMAKWTPPAPEPASEDKEEDDDEEKDDDGEEKDDKKKKKKKERDPAKPVTGVFEGTSPSVEGSKVRLRLLEAADGSITGSMRASYLDGLHSVSGSRDGYDVTLEVDLLDATLDVSLAQVYSNDPPPKGAKKKSKEEEEADAKKPVETFLRGEAKWDGDRVETLDLTQVSTEYKVAARPVRIPEKAKRASTPKGMPKKPSVDPDLEPIRRAMSGGAAVIVRVNRDDQILSCVDTFESFGLRPILFEANDAYKVADKIAGRVSGVLVPRSRMSMTDSAGNPTSRLGELAAAGIPVAFMSQAEEGAAELGVIAARAVAMGLSPTAALRALTSDAARMLCIEDRVGTIAPGKDADIIVLDGSPMEVSSTIERVFVNGAEVR